MDVHINKAGNNKAIIEIKNSLAAIGNDTGLDSGNNIPRNLDVGGNKTPVEESVAALYNELFHSCASLRAY